MKVCERKFPVTQYVDLPSLLIYFHSRYTDTNCAEQSGTISGIVYTLLHRFQEKGLSRNAFHLHSRRTRFQTRPVHFLCRRGVVSPSLSDKYSNRDSNHATTASFHIILNSLLTLYPTIRHYSLS
jgi:hypothetical protein